MTVKPTNKPIEKQFFFWAAVLILVWAGVPVLAKQGAEQLNGFEMTFWINLFAMPLVTLWVFSKEHRESLIRYSVPTILRLASIGFLGNLLYQILYFGSYKTITAIAGSILGRFGGVLFVVASIVFLKERHSKSYIVALILAIVGSIFSAVKPGASLEFSITGGFWLMVVATMLNTGYMFANNGIKARFPDTRANLFIFKASTLIVIATWSILTYSGLITTEPAFDINLSPHLADLRVPFLLGVFADGIGFLAFLKVLELSDSVKTTIVNATVAVTQVFLAVLIFRESASFINAILAPSLVIIPTTIAGIMDTRTKVE